MWEKTKRMVKITKIRAAYFAAFGLYTSIKTNNLGRMSDIDM
jgi:hypothetical protein